MDEIERRVVINTLTKSKLGEFFGWSAPKPVHDVGPSNTERFEQFELKVRIVEQEVRAGLDARDDDELRSLVSESGDGATIDWFQSLMSEEIAGLAKKQPKRWFGLSEQFRAVS